jgi:hypothetical protein
MGTFSVCAYVFYACVCLCLRAESTCFKRLPTVYGYIRKCTAHAHIHTYIHTAHRCMSYKRKHIQRYLCLWLHTLLPCFLQVFVCICMHTEVYLHAQMSTDTHIQHIVSKFSLECVCACDFIHTRRNVCAHTKTNTCMHACNAYMHVMHTCIFICAFFDVKASCFLRNLYMCTYYGLIPPLPIFSYETHAHKHTHTRTYMHASCVETRACYLTYIQTCMHAYIHTHDTFCRWTPQTHKYFVPRALCCYGKIYVCMYACMYVCMTSVYAYHEKSTSTHVHHAELCTTLFVVLCT